MSQKRYGNLLTSYLGIFWKVKNVFSSCHMCSVWKFGWLLLIGLWLLCVHVSSVKAPLLAYNSFIEAIFFLNDCHAHSGHTDSRGSRSENRLFSIRLVCLRWSRKENRLQMTYSPISCLLIVFPEEMMRDQGLKECTFMFLCCNKCFQSTFWRLLQSYAQRSLLQHLMVH